MRAALLLVAAATTAAAVAACASDEENPSKPRVQACAELESTFKSNVTRVLTQKCATCHNASGAAKGTRLLVSADDQTPALATVAALVSEKKGASSLLLGKVVGDGHGGGAVLQKESDDYRVLEVFTDMVGGNCAGAAKAQPAHVNQRFLRRLSPDEYENTLVDLVQMPGYGKSLPVESREEVFDNIAGELRTDTDYFQQILDNARTIAESPDLKWQGLASCTSGDAACARTMIGEFGLRAFRRPVTPDDLLRYTALYDQIGAGNHERGIRAIVRGMLGSPHFLFRTELGKKNPDGKVNDLTPWEIASELSYLFWATMPDRALFDAARDGKLVTKADVRAQAERLLADPRAAVAQQRFASQWLNLPLLADKAKDPMVFPSFDRDAQNDLRDETLAFFVETTRATEDGTLRALLTGEHGYLTERGARFYGVPWEGPAIAGAGTARKQVALPGRPGILAQASILALGATATEPIAILRGKLVRTRILCQHIGEPPANAAAITAALPAPKNNRERASQLLGNPNCSACHQKMDPIGLGYEGFNAIGMPAPGADTTGEVLFAPTAAGAFDGPKSLHDKLAGSAEVQQCFSKLWMAHAYGVSESEEGAALVKTLAADFATNQTRIAGLLLALTQTDHFMKRNADPDEEAPPPATAPTATPPGPGGPSPDAGGGSSSGGVVPDVPTTPGVTFQAQAGYENGGKEEGAGNWWIRGTITNTTNQPITGWAYRMDPRPGDFVMSSKLAVGAAGNVWIFRSGSQENQTLEANRGYYVDLKFSK